MFGTTVLENSIGTGLGALKGSRNKGGHPCKWLQIKKKGFSRVITRPADHARRLLKSRGSSGVWSGGVTNITGRDGSCRVGSEGFQISWVGTGYPGETWPVKKSDKKAPKATSYRSHGLKMWYHAIPCYIIPYHTIPYHTIPYHTIPYHTIPYHGENSSNNTRWVSPECAFNMHVPCCTWKIN